MEAWFNLDADDVWWQIDAEKQTTASFRKEKLKLKTKDQQETTL